MSKKRSFMIIFVLIMSIFAAWPMNNVSANISIPHEPDFEWGIEINDFLGFEIDTLEGPFAGTKWMRGFELNQTYPHWSDPYYLSRINFTELIFSLEHDCIEDSGRVRGYQFNSTHEFYFDFNSVLDMYEPIFAPVIILPLNISSTVDLDFWGNFLTSNYENYYEYYNLTNYNVNGNELQCYNSTTGDYINATYDPNDGTLISAEISVYKYYGPYWSNYVQRYSRFYDKTVGLHPLDETASTLSVGNSLIYKEGYGEAWEYNSYNITSIERSTTEYSGQDFPAIQVNASLHHWNQGWEMWELDDGSDPFIEKSIGGGSDFGMQVSMYESGAGSLVYPAGITGELLNATLSPIYSQYGGLGESEIGPWSVKLFNSSSNQFLYIELDGASGILKNATYTMGEYISSRIRSNEEELPQAAGTDETSFVYTVDDNIFYSTLYRGEDTGVPYENEGFSKYVITNASIRSGEYYRIYDLIWEINASMYDWDDDTSEWILSEHEEENAAIGVANNAGNYHCENGPINMLYAEGTTGQDIEDLYDDIYVDPISPYYAFDSVVSDANSAMFTNTTSGDFMYIELFSNGTVYNFTLDRTEIFANGGDDGGPAYMQMIFLPKFEVICPKYYTIHASTGINGDIDPEGDIEVLEGDDITFNFTPDKGYLVDDVFVDGGSVGNLSSYTFSNIKSNHTIEVTFKEDPGNDTGIKISGYSLVFFLLINCAIVSVITILIHRRRLN